MSTGFTVRPATVVDGGGRDIATFTDTQQAIRCLASIARALQCAARIKVSPSYAHPEPLPRGVAREKDHLEYTIYIARP